MNSKEYFAQAEKLAQIAKETAREAQKIEINSYGQGTLYVEKKDDDYIYSNENGIFEEKSIKNYLDSISDEQEFAESPSIALDTTASQIIDNLTKTKQTLSLDFKGADSLQIDGSFKTEDLTKAFNGSRGINGFVAEPQLTKAEGYLDQAEKWVQIVSEATNKSMSFPIHLNDTDVRYANYDLNSDNNELYYTADLSGKISSIRSKDEILRELEDALEKDNGALEKALDNKGLPDMKNFMEKEAMEEIKKGLETTNYMINLQLKDGSFLFIDKDIDVDKAAKEIHDAGGVKNHQFKEPERVKGEEKNLELISFFNVPNNFDIKNETMMSVDEKAQRLLQMYDKAAEDNLVLSVKMEDGNYVTIDPHLFDADNYKNERKNFCRGIEIPKELKVYSPDNQEQNKEYAHQIQEKKLEYFKDLVANGAQSAKVCSTERAAKKTPEGRWWLRHNPGYLRRAAGETFARGVVSIPGKIAQAFSKFFEMCIEQAR